MELPENTGINKYIIELKNGKQLPSEPIYNISLLELQTLKTYIKTHLKTKFIQPSKSLAGTPIQFNKKSDNSFYIYMDYWGLNNPIIKNRYPLPLINKSLDQLGQAEKSLQLDLTSTYYKMRIKKDNK